MLQGPRISRAQSWDDDILLTQTNWKNNWIASWGVKVDLDMIGHRARAGSHRLISILCTNVRLQSQLHNPISQGKAMRTILGFEIQFQLENNFKPHSSCIAQVS